MRISMLLALLVIGSVLSAQAPAPSATKGDAEAGKKLYVSYGCYQCHGYSAQGGVGPRLAPRPMAFDALTKYVRKPAGEMPPYTAKVVTDKELTDIYAFLSSVPAPPDANTIPLLK